jgi:hypothetical protein
VCRDLLNVFLKKSLSSESLILGHVNEFVCQQPKVSRAVQANYDAIPRRQTPSIGGEQASLHPLAPDQLVSPNAPPLAASKPFA